MENNIFTFDFSALPKNVVRKIFGGLSEAELTVCESVCQGWGNILQEMRDEDELREILREIDDYEFSEENTDDDEDIISTGSDDDSFSSETSGYAEFEAQQLEIMEKKYKEAIVRHPKAEIDSIKETEEEIRQQQELNQFFESTTIEMEHKDKIHDNNVFFRSQPKQNPNSSTGQKSPHFDEYEDTPIVNVTLWKEVIAGPNIFTQLAGYKQIFHTVLSIGKFNIDFGRFGIRIVMVDEDERMSDGSLTKIDSCMAQLNGTTLQGIIASLSLGFKGAYYDLRINSCLNFTLAILRGIAATSKVEFKLNAGEVWQLMYEARDSWLASLVNLFTEAPSSTRKLKYVKCLFDSQNCVISFIGDNWWY